jgi:hypothetical protein
MNFITFFFVLISKKGCPKLEDEKLSERFSDGVEFGKIDPCKTGCNATASDCPMASMAGFEWAIFRIASRRESSADVSRDLTWGRFYESVPAVD